MQGDNPHRKTSDAGICTGNGFLTNRDQCVLGRGDGVESSGRLIRVPCSRWVEADSLQSARDDADATSSLLRSSLLRVRFKARARPPARPAARASSESNSCALPLRCAARPPFAAISRCFAASMPAKPRRLGLLSGVGVSAMRSSRVMEGVVTASMRVTHMPQSSCQSYSMRERVDRSLSAHRCVAAL